MEQIKYKESKPDFFSEKIKATSGILLEVAGAAFVLAGLYEFVSGTPIDHIINSCSDQIPDIAKTALNHLANMPLIIKASGGASMIWTGQDLTNSK